MIKQLKLIALFVAVSLIQPIHAGEKMSKVKDGAKKVVKVAWHAGQTATGCLVVLIVCNDLSAQKLTMVESGVATIAGATLLNAGLRGLNRELKISEYAGKLAAYVGASEKSPFASEE